LGAHQHPDASIAESFDCRFARSFVAAVEAGVAGRDQLGGAFIPTRAVIVAVEHNRFMPAMWRQRLAVRLETSKRNHDTPIGQLFVFHLRTVVAAPDHFGNQLVIGADSMHPNVQVPRQTDFGSHFPVELFTADENAGHLRHSGLQDLRVVQDPAVADPVAGENRFGQ